jgi:hypothetical protein
MRSSRDLHVVRQSSPVTQTPEEVGPKMTFAEYLHIPDVNSCALFFLGLGSVALSFIAGPGWLLMRFLFFVVGAFATVLAADALVWHLYVAYVS